MYRDYRGLNHTTYTFVRDGPSCPCIKYLHIVLAQCYKSEFTVNANHMGLCLDLFDQRCLATPRILDVITVHRLAVHRVLPHEQRQDQGNPRQPRSNHPRRCDRTCPRV